MKKIPIIIDCDPGHDDAIALAVACASEKLDIRAVTVVAGNQTLEKTLRNAKKILNFIGKRPLLAAGADKPMFRELQTAPDFHGESGLDGPVIPDPADYKEEAVPAWDLIRRIAAESPEPLTLVPTGPLTNIGILFTAYPEVKGRIAGISLMGGSLFAGGNRTSAAEFNILVDPEAAGIVFSSGVPITMCGLDVTNKAFILPEEVETLRSTGRVGRFLAELIDFYSDIHLKQGFKGAALHDPCAVLALTAPELFQTGHFHVDIETEGRLTLGMTLADLRPWTGAGANVTACLDIDRNAFIRVLHDASASYGW
ncbi:MAG: nucleoside hydrolase [Spirochaetaceae bacterium]|jgi:pyrimidine-specific ribonucleoside hydrolase|nr:nucleoside hydrolase [Spirochaetaceae bacterium]